MVVAKTNVAGSQSYRPKPELFQAKKDVDGFLEEVNYKISAITLDTALGSDKSNNYIDSLLDLTNKKILTSKWVKYYTDIMWKQAVFWLLMYFAFYSTMTILLTLHVFYQENETFNEHNLNTDFLYVISGLCIFSWINEISEMVTQKLMYFWDFWNICDLSSNVLVTGYCVNILILDRDADKELVLALAIFFAWFRCISYLRLWD